MHDHRQRLSEIGRTGTTLSRRWSCCPGWSPWVCEGGNDVALCQRPSQNRVLLRLLGSVCWEWQPGRGMLWSVASRTSDIFGTHAECPLGGGAGQGGAWSARLWCAWWVYSRSMSKIRDGSSPVWLCPPSWRLEWPVLSASELCQRLVTARWWRSAYRSTRHCMSSGILLGSRLGWRLSSDSVGWGTWRRHYWRPW